MPLNRCFLDLTGIFWTFSKHNHCKMHLQSCEFRVGKYMRTLLLRANGTSHRTNLWAAALDLLLDRHYAVRSAWHWLAIATPAPPQKFTAHTVPRGARCARTGTVAGRLQYSDRFRKRADWQYRAAWPRQLVPRILRRFIGSIPKLIYLITGGGGNWWGLTVGGGAMVR